VLANDSARRLCSPKDRRAVRATCWLLGTLEQCGAPRAGPFDVPDAGAPGLAPITADSRSFPGLALTRVALDPGSEIATRGLTRCNRAAVSADDMFWPVRADRDRASAVVATDRGNHAVVRSERLIHSTVLGRRTSLSVPAMVWGLVMVESWPI
jgi:hypothetical protein